MGGIRHPWGLHRRLHPSEVRIGIIFLASRAEGVRRVPVRALVVSERGLHDFRGLHSSEARTD